MLWPDLVMGDRGPQVIDGYYALLPSLNNVSIPIPISHVSPHAHVLFSMYCYFKYKDDEAKLFYRN